MKRGTTLGIGPLLMEGVGLTHKIAAAIWAMEHIHTNRPYRAQVNVQRRRYEALPEDPTTWAESDQSTAEDIWLVLETILEEHLPPYCHLAEVDGIPTVLPDEEQIRYDQHDQQLASVRTQLKIATAYVLETNDHGNRTLFRKVRAGRGHHWMEVWSVV